MWGTHVQSSHASVCVCTGVCPCVYNTPSVLTHFPTRLGQRHTHTPAHTRGLQGSHAGLELTSRAVLAETMAPGLRGWAAHRQGVAPSAGAGRERPVLQAPPAPPGSSQKASALREWALVGALSPPTPLAARGPYTRHPHRVLNRKWARRAAGVTLGGEGLCRHSG